MPPRIAIPLRIFALLLAVLLGKIPCHASALLGLAIRQRSIAYGLALGLSVSLLLLVQDSDSVLRWGAWSWRLYNHLLIDGVPSQLGDLVVNLAFAVLGVRIGRAARMGVPRRPIRAGRLANRGQDARTAGTPSPGAGASP